MSSRNNIAPQHIVLAFSGGLDTSVALVWLKERYNCRLTAFIANLGQGAELDTAACKAEKLGADEVRVVDLTRRVRPGLCLPDVPGQRPL
ncbi:argininosuccinate synthase domain-containing protein [Salinispora arenicola]|uniref:argininosuccinate synthase domain-containing protein n=1 Tax=Salinispora arenicola TaxID=168697 RepID=UPI0027DC6E2D|nr:argininosuccinate synthase domain-containing protein [Salinispora arenicola]